MNKKLISFTLIFIMVIFTSCQKNTIGNIDGELNENDVVDTEDTRIEIQEMSDIFQNTEGNNTNISGSENASVSDSENNQNTEYYISYDEIDINVRNIYDKVITNELANPRYGEQSINYGFGYVNEDDIPELFLIRGSSHVDTVTIYTFDEITSEGVYVGDFGGWGYCDYVPHENKIISCYGNQGYFYITVSKINDNNAPELVDVILRNGGNRIESFYGFDLDGFTGAIDWVDYDINQFKAPDERYLISEEEADQIESVMRNGYVHIDDKNICDNIISNQ